MSDPIGLRVYCVTLDFGGGADVKFLAMDWLAGGDPRFFIPEVRPTTFPLLPVGSTTSSPAVGLL